MMPIHYRRSDNLQASEAEARIGEAVRDGYESLGDLLVDRLKQRAPKASRRYERSIKRRVVGRGIKSRLIVFSTAGAEAEAIEKGRPKGKQTPVEELLPWVRLKGLGAGSASKQRGIAFAIGRKHAKEGLPRRTGFAPSHRLFMFRDLESDYASQISSSMTSIRIKVAAILNS